MVCVSEKFFVSRRASLICTGETGEQEQEKGSSSRDAMARKQARPAPTLEVTLEALQIRCRVCGSRMRMGHHSHRTVSTLQGVTRLTLKVYRCRNTECPRYHHPTRPEEEGGWALPHGEFGLDVIALVGTLRYQQQRSLPQMDLPIVGVITDGQHSIRNAVAHVLPGVPHQLCHFHYLREAAKPIAEADRHAKKELKKHVRGVRPLERELEGRTDEEAEAVRGYCLAVRSALTDDGHPPLDADGLKLQERLQAIDDSISLVAEKRGFPTNLIASNDLCATD